MFTNSTRFRPDGSSSPIGSSWLPYARSDNQLPLIDYSYTDLGGGQIEILEHTYDGFAWSQNTWIFQLSAYSDYAVWEVGVFDGAFYVVYEDTYWGAIYWLEGPGGPWEINAYSPEVTGIGLLWFDVNSNYILSTGASGYLGVTYGPSDLSEHEHGSPYLSDGSYNIASLNYGTNMPFAAGFTALHWLVDDELAFIDRQIYRWDGSSSWVDQVPGQTFDWAQTTPGVRGGPRLVATRSSNTFTLFADNGGSGLTALSTVFTTIGEMRGMSPTWAVFAGGESSTGTELWITDGTPAGTHLQCDLLPGPGSSNPRHFRVSGNRVFFIADAPAPNTLWVMAEHDIGWTRNPTNGAFYKLTQPGSWHAAIAEARANGGTLATIRDDEEQSWIWSTFGPEHLWIGLHDLDQNGIFEWASGESVRYFNWCPSQPNGGTVGETVVHISNYPGWCAGPWNDQDPYDIYRGIIERRPPPTPVEAIGTGCRNATAEWSSGNPSPGDRLGLAFNMGPSFGSGIIAAISDLSARGRTPLDLGQLLGDPTLDGCMLRVTPGTSPTTTTPASSAAWTVDWEIPSSIPSGIDLDVQGIGLTTSHQIHVTNSLRVHIR